MCVSSRVRLSASKHPLLPDGGRLQRAPRVLRQHMCCAACAVLRVCPPTWNCSEGDKRVRVSLDNTTRGVARERLAPYTRTVQQQHHDVAKIANGWRNTRDVFSGVPPTVAKIGQMSDAGSAKGSRAGSAKGSRAGSAKGSRAGSAAGSAKAGSMPTPPKAKPQGTMREKGKKKFTWNGSIAKGSQDAGLGSTHTNIAAPRHMSGLGACVGVRSPPLPLAPIAAVSVCAQEQQRFPCNSSCATNE
jgi:hypothetical protein